MLPREASRAELRAFQAVVAILSLIPISTGAAGVLLGPSFLAVESPWPVDLDSHFRFLSGVFFAIGLCLLFTVPKIAFRTARFRMLCGLIFLGGLARLLSLAMVGAPSIGHQIGLFLELVMVPLLLLWQNRVSSFSR